MFNRMIVQTALRLALGLDDNARYTPYNPADSKSSVISQLIYDVFGGEILKTHKKKDWHFYNRINGERFDFTKSEMDKLSQKNSFEDLPSNTDEIHNYFEPEEYSTFFVRFIWEFEEVVGLKKSLSGFSI
jgi:hypothetical protein